MVPVVQPLQDPCNKLLFSKMPLQQEKINHATQDKKKMIAPNMNPLQSSGGYSAFLEVLSQIDQSYRRKAHIVQMSESLIQKGSTSRCLALEQGYVCDCFSLYDLFCSRIVFESRNAILLKVFELVKFQKLPMDTNESGRRTFMIKRVTSILMRSVVIIGEAVLSSRFQNNPSCKNALDGILKKMREENVRLSLLQSAVRAMHGIGEFVENISSLYNSNLTLQKRIDILELCVVTVASRLDSSGNKGNNRQHTGRLFLTTKDAQDAFSLVMNAGRKLALPTSSVSLLSTNEQFCNLLGRILSDDSIGVDEIDYHTPIDSSFEADTNDNQGNESAVNNCKRRQPPEC